MKSEDLQKHVTATYVNLRIGMAVIAMAFPILLWVGGLLQGLELQPSMSDDYHAGSPTGLMRDWFVGLLFAVGVFLYLYKGFTVAENILLNFAGTFAIEVFAVYWLLKTRELATTNADVLALENKLGD